MLESHPTIHILGAGLAGSEAALQLANQGFRVQLYDMKPAKRSPAHHNNTFAEIVCSNSFGSQNNEESVSASGLLKQELNFLNCQLLQIAQTVAVPAGKALAVDRDAFTNAVTERILAHPNIHCIAQEVTEIPDDGLVLIATGPLTSEALTANIAKRLEQSQLYFFDAAAPILTKDSIDFSIAFMQDRYELEQSSDQVSAPAGSYINCPLEKSDYTDLVDMLLQGEKIELKDFEKERASYFESCMPVEVIASRGFQTLRFGPMKPMGLVDPRTQRRPYAVVQLRQDNQQGTLYNMVGFQTNLKWGIQKEMIQRIPGLQNAEVVRYGVMHRNTYIHSPATLHPTLQLKKESRIFFAGQLTGTEGYTESIATGLIAAQNIKSLAQGIEATVPPPETMIGSLLRYITRPEAINKSFQPINSNWGILPALDESFNIGPKDKKGRNRAYVARSLAALKQCSEP